MSNNTEALISKLVASHQAVRPFIVVPILLLTLLVLAVFALFLVLPLGIRADWPIAAVLKSAALLALTATFLMATIMSSGPALPYRQQIGVFSIIMLVAIMLLMTFAKLGTELSVERAVLESSFWACVSWIALVGGSAVLILHRVLRRARPAKRQIFRLAVPLCAALLAASVYSLHCPVDALTYLFTAYLFASVLVVSFSWWLSRHLWRW